MVYEGDAETVGSDGVENEIEEARPTHSEVLMAAETLTSWLEKKGEHTYIAHAVETYKRLGCHKANHYTAVQKDFFNQALVIYKIVFCYTFVQL